MLPKSNYKFISSHYTSIIDGGGMCCENCGRLIANIVKIQDGNKTFYIGADCAETILGKEDLKSAKELIKQSKKQKEIQIKKLCNMVSKLYGKSCLFNEQDKIDLYNIAVKVFSENNVNLPKEYQQYKPK